MTIRKLLAFSLFASSFLPIPAVGQCKDSLCQNLQNILYASVTDFRAYRMNLASPPNLSTGGAKIPCHMTAWINDVGVYMCNAQLPDSLAESWYENTLSSLGVLRPSWYFRIDSPPTGHQVDGGPPDCVVSPNDGPYIGDCPFHLDVTKQADGMAKISLWVNSLSSPNLDPAPPTATAESEVPIVGDACDKMCQGLKQALQVHLQSFAAFHAARANGGGETSSVANKLPGARECEVRAAVSSGSNEVGTQYVCYWPEASGAAADAQFRDLVSRLQVLVPSNWSTRQEEDLDQLSGAKVSAWVASAPGDKQEVSVYVSAESVGFHIKAWTNSLTAQIPR